VIPDEHEFELSRQTEAGREMTAALRRIRAGLTGEQRLEKAFELTEMTRQVMRAGIKEAHPDWNERQVQEQYIDRLLQPHGLSLESLRAKCDVVADSSE